MRTTLTIDDDVAAMLNQLRKQRKETLKRLVNEALRDGLARMMSPRPGRRRFRTRAINPGRCRLPNVDNIAELLAIAEGEDYR